MSPSENQFAIQTPTGGARPGTAAWTGRTSGGYFGNWFFIQLIRRLGVWPAYLWLAVVAAYFTIVHRDAYRASADYLGRLFGPLPWWRRPLLVYRHFLAHGVTLVDRLAVLMGRSQIECIIEGEELFPPHLEQGRGIILVGAHVGCWELGGHFLGRFDRPVNLVVIERELEGIQRLMNSVTGGKRFRILTADEDPLRSVPILAALRRGEIVALLGDRSLGSPDLEACFLGGRVRLPVGPYRLAAASGAPLFQVFTVRQRLGCYRFATFPPEFISREEVRSDPDAVPARARRYAERLEAVVREYPFQWANFFPYWEPGTGTAPAARPMSNPAGDQLPIP
jgi:predicted LPLAT superfamily acyltransferase